MAELLLQEGAKVDLLDAHGDQPPLHVVKCMYGTTNDYQKVHQATCFFTELR